VYDILQIAVRPSVHRTNYRSGFGRISKCQIRYSPIAVAYKGMHFTVVINGVECVLDQPEFAVYILAATRAEVKLCNILSFKQLLALPLIKVCVLEICSI
jgi:hypothetical protein